MRAGCNNPEARNDRENEEKKRKERGRNRREVESRAARVSETEAISH